MGGVSNGDDFLSPCSELPPLGRRHVEDDHGNSPSGCPSERATSHGTACLGREGPLAWFWGEGRGGLGSRVASFIYRRRPPSTTSLGSLLLRATSGSTTIPFLAPLPAQGPLPEEPNPRLERSTVRVIPIAHHVVQCS